MQGIGALEMLNIMERFNLGQFGLNSANALHVQIEAKKLAYADVIRYIGDPKTSKLPVAGMLSKDYAANRAKLIDMGHANCEVPPGAPAPGAGDTTYLSVVDREGNMVSLIQSNYAEFGSGLVADGTGFVLHDRGALFSLDPASPNKIAGHKRPLHTIIPGFMQKDQLRIAFGIMGGWNQGQAHAQFVSHIVDFGQNIQAALETPRFTKMTFSRVRCGNGRPHSSQYSCRPRGQGPSARVASWLLGRLWRRPSGYARFCRRRELRCIGSKKRWRRYSRVEQHRLACQLVSPWLAILLASDILDRCA